VTNFLSPLSTMVHAISLSQAGDVLKIKCDEYDDELKEHRRFQEDAL
jgi:hypothetical protein